MKENTHKVEFKTNGIITEIYIDGVKQNRVRKFKFEQAVGEVPVFTIERNMHDTETSINECYIKEVVQEEQP